MTKLIRGFWVLGLALILVLPMTLLLVFGPILPVEAQEEAKSQYVGVQSCAKICHKTAKQGEQLKIWEASKHANAYATLATPAAKEIAAKMKIADPQKADECLACHTTAHGVAADLKGAKFSHEEGVGCEACHGAGSLYKKRTVMKDREKAVAAGLVIPNKETCLKCHNEESPTYKEFDYDARVKTIAHAKPAAE